jgi:hypothetical protein
MTLRAAMVGSEWAAEFEHPFTLRLDLQVGGWAGDTTAATKFPAKMLVDWIHVSTSDLSLAVEARRSI